VVCEHHKCYAIVIKDDHVGVEDDLFFGCAYRGGGKEKSTMRKFLRIVGIKICLLFTYKYLNTTQQLHLD
jgi:hypothetical protein